LTPLLLPSGEVHLWWANAEDPRNEDASERQSSVLSMEERVRLGRFKFEKNRREFRVSHALVRTALSAYAEAVEPADWTFSANAHGRPSIAEPRGYEWLCFNLSHTSGGAVVAITRDGAIGVDVENAERIADKDGIAEANFHPAEIAALRCDPALFFDFWVLKEAYLKAMGFGLGAVALDSFWFSLGDGMEPRIGFESGATTAGDPGRWWFHVEHRGTLRLALAAETGGRPLRIVERHVVPRSH
jgi:4'-phosphopantetheinyl transferase